MRSAVFALALLAGPVSAETLLIAPQQVTEWKSVYATVEARRTVPARARIGGTVSAISVSEGDHVAAGAQIGLVEDDKLAFQLASLDAQIAAAQATLENAQAELARGEALVERGVSTAQRLDALRTQVDVAGGQISSLKAERDRITQTQAEGALLAPAEGVVLTVPVAAGEVILPGEPVATVGTGGFFLRLAIPERYADSLKQGAAIRIGDGDNARQGTLAKIYPLIEGGRVQADIEVRGSRRPLCRRPGAGAPAGGQPSGAGGAGRGADPPRRARLRHRRRRRWPGRARRGPRRGSGRRPDRNRLWP